MSFNRKSFKFIHLIYRQIDYQASSPDEKALVEGCAKIGFLFCGESNSTLSLKLLNRRVSELSIIVFYYSINQFNLSFTGPSFENFKSFGIKI